MSYSISDKLTLKQLFVFISPTILMFIFLTTYTIIDGIFVSRFVSPSGLAGLNIAYPVISVLAAIAIMFGTGGSAYVSHKLGEGKEKEAYSAFSLLTLLLIIISVIYSIIALYYSEELCLFLGSNEVILPYSKDYLIGMMTFGIFNALQWFFQSFFVAASKPNLGFLLTFIGGVLNILFDYIFIVLFELGISGAAYATALSWIVVAVGGLYFFWKNKSGITFVRPVFQWEVIIKSMVNGSSEMVSIISSSITTILFNRYMLSFLGEDGVAALTSALYFDFLIISVFMGFIMGVSPVIAYHFGAGNKEYLKNLIRSSYYIVIAVSISIYISCVFFSYYIAEVFFEKDTNVYELAKTGLVIYSLAFLFKGANMLTSGIFTALNNGVVSGVFSFLRTFVFLVPTIIIFAYFWQDTGLWYSVAMAEFLAFLLILYTLKILRKQYQLI